MPVRFALLQILRRQTDQNREQEADFERQIDAFIADADARVGRSGTDDEAQFYLANAYLLRAEYRFSHDKGIWGAVRDGARSKRGIDAYVKRHPEHGDAYYALGTYNYFVEIGPAFIKFIRPAALPARGRSRGRPEAARARLFAGEPLLLSRGDVAARDLRHLRGPSGRERPHRRTARGGVPGQSLGAVPARRGV
jgi:hypothetical protein